MGIAMNHNGKVLINSVDIRTGPSTSFAKIGTLSLNETVLVTEMENQYYKHSRGGWSPAMTGNRTINIKLTKIESNYINELLILK
jgi:hypothetical protein